jgi:hypothetical protein
MQPSAVVLFEDEIILRLFPVLRRAWSQPGEQATIAITGENQQRVLFGTINMYTGQLIWLPKQCPELNAMDHLWKEVKSDISANYQYATVREHADFAETYILKLTNQLAKFRAGILSKNFWLKSFFK